MTKPKLLRITTVPISLKTLLKGQHRFMSQNGFEVLGISSEGEELRDVEREENIRTIAVEITRKITPLKDFRALIQLIRLMQKEKPNIVHTHTPKAGLLGMIAAWVTGVPHRLHTVAGMPLTVATGAKRKLLDFTEKLTYACATKVYPNSYGLRDLIVEYKFTKVSKLKVIGKGSSNGIDTSEFDPALVSEKTKIDLKKELGIKADDFVFLFVGRIVSDKGINELVKSFKQVKQTKKEDGRTTHLVLVGDYEKDLDSLEKEIENTIESDAHIHAIGYKTNVVDYFAMANVLVFPSYREGFPNVVMQAAAMQLNAIVSDINGCNEIVKDGENGWIVPAKEINLLRDRMQWCFENPEESKRMGLKSREIMIRDYERNYVHAELLKEYRSLLGIRN